MSWIEKRTESSSDEDANNKAGAMMRMDLRSRPSSVTFTPPFADRTRTSETIYTRHASYPADSQAIEDGDADTSNAPLPLRRTRSNDPTPRVREEWGKELWSRGALKDSMVLLRSSVDEYEKEASRQQWIDLRKINDQVADLGKLADEARKTKHGKVGDDGDDDESSGGLSKFSAVALEYSKMLDVVMNQSPEYAGLAWGVCMSIPSTLERILTPTGHTNAPNCPHQPQ